MKLRIWTRAYRPFMMGGDVNTPVSTEVEASDPIVMPLGAICHVVVNPKGQTFVIDSVSGGIVGDSVEAVRADLEEAKTRGLKDSDIAEQLEQQKVAGSKATPMSNEEFWAMLRD